MGERLRVLIVEDSEDDAALLVRQLRRDGYDPTAQRVETAAAMAAALAAAPWDLVLADYNLPQFDALGALAVLRESGVDAPFIVVSGAIGDETAVAAMKAGAHDYLMKGNLTRLVPAVQRELREAEDRRQRRVMEQHARRAEKLAALGTLVAGIAHELNNPIGILASRIQVMLLEGQDLSPEVRQDLEVLHRQTQRIARITEGLLSFARQSPPQRASVDLNNVVAETLLLAEKGMVGGGIDIDAVLAPDLPPIAGDPNELQQVVLNLLTNARDAIDGAGTIRVETRRGRTDRVELSVTDTGRGMSPAEISRIFDPFFTTKAKGTGLGLAISDGIIRAHGGTIDVESAPGRGTRFLVTLPVIPAGPSPPG